MFDIDFKFDEAQMKMLDAVPVQMLYHVLDKCMPAMAKPIIEKAKRIAPRSEVTGTRDLWGKNKTEHFDPEVWKRDTSGDHIGSKVVKKGIDGSYIKVGSKSPRGNKQRFNQMKYTARRVFYWGKDMGMTYTPKERFMQRSYDETIPQQVAAFSAALASFKFK